MGFDTAWVKNVKQMLDIQTHDQNFKYSLYIILSGHYK